MLRLLGTAGLTGEGSGWGCGVSVAAGGCWSDSSVENGFGSESSACIAFEPSDTEQLASTRFPTRSRFARFGSFLSSQGAAAQHEIQGEPRRVAHVPEINHFPLPPLQDRHPQAHRHHRAPHMQVTQREHPSLVVGSSTALALLSSLSTGRSRWYVPAPRWHETDGANGRLGIHIRHGLCSHRVECEQRAVPRDCHRGAGSGTQIDQSPSGSSPPTCITAHARFQGAMESQLKLTKKGGGGGGNGATVARPYLTLTIKSVVRPSPFSLSIPRDPSDWRW